VYIQDILFKAGLHPLRLANTLDDAGIEKLHKAVLDRLNLSKDKGGLIYEVDLLGRKGGFSDEDYLVGYREEKPCPVCGTTIAKIKTGSTSSYICPKCQPLVQ
jgi:formamidopyrimidine-DNA glycosylase